MTESNPRKHQWSTTVEIHDLSGDLDIDSLFLELLLYDRGVSPNSVDDDVLELGERLPAVTRLKTELIDTRVLNYIKQYFQLVLTPTQLRSRCWRRHTVTGAGLDLHNHRESHISAVFYLESGGGSLVLCDPRAGAGRSYPPQLQQYFKSMEYSPNKGDLVIFPSYLYHQVLRDTPQLRVAIALDYFIDI